MSPRIAPIKSNVHSYLGNVDGFLNTEAVKHTEFNNGLYFVCVAYCYVWSFLCIIQDKLIEDRDLKCLTLPTSKEVPMSFS